MLSNVNKISIYLRDRFSAILKTSSVSLIFQGRVQFLISRKYWKEAIGSLSKYQSCRVIGRLAKNRRRRDLLFAIDRPGTPANGEKVEIVECLRCRLWALGLNFIMQAAAAARDERKKREIEGERVNEGEGKERRKGRKCRDVRIKNSVETMRGCGDNETLRYENISDRTSKGRSLACYVLNDRARQRAPLRLPLSEVRTKYVQRELYHTRRKTWTIRGETFA